MADAKTKVCLSCGKRKLRTAFYPLRKNSPDKRRPSCKICVKNRNRDWLAANPDRAKEYRDKHGWTLAKRCARRGVDLDIFLATLERQDGCCAICREPLQAGENAIDHNHSTGKFRGVLCKQCNRALGMFRDSPTVLKSALMYLETAGHYGDRSGEFG